MKPKLMKILIICGGIIMLLLAALIINISIPKKIEKILPLKNIEKIEYRGKDDVEFKEIDDTEFYLFLEKLENIIYKRKVTFKKSTNTQEYKLTYKDGSIVTFGNKRIDKINASGKKVCLSSTEYKLYWKGKLIESEWKE